MIMSKITRTAAKRVVLLLRAEVFWLPLFDGDSNNGRIGSSFWNLTLRWILPSLPNDEFILTSSSGMSSLNPLRFSIVISISSTPCFLPDSISSFTTSACFSGSFDDNKSFKNFKAMPRGLFKPSKTANALSTPDFVVKSYTCFMLIILISLLFNSFNG